MVSNTAEIYNAKKADLMKLINPALPALQQFVFYIFDEQQRVGL